MLKAHVRKSVGSIPTDCNVFFAACGRMFRTQWGCSSLGRAVGSQSAGTGIETLLLHSFCSAYRGGTKKEATPTRFELARAEPSRFLIYLLNHSDTVSGSCQHKHDGKKDGVMRESNSRPPAPEAGIIPLDQSPSHGNKSGERNTKKRSDSDEIRTRAGRAQ